MHADVSTSACGPPRLPGPLPSEWQLPSLATLALGDTLLTGTLPGNWGQPSNLGGLEQLSLRGCRLNGERALAAGGRVLLQVCCRAEL